MAPTAIRCILYNFSGEVDEISHLFPNERLARMAATVRAQDAEAVILDRANFADLRQFDAEFMRNLGGLTFHDTNDAYERGVAEEASRVLDASPDMILMNLWHGSGFKFSVDMARRLKTLSPGLPVYGIGQKVDWFKEHILQVAGTCFDGLLTGLGYEGARRLVAGDAPEEVPGMILRSAGGVTCNPAEPIDVDDFPSPDYDSGTYRHIAEKVPIYSVSLSNLACPNGCAFCVRPENYGRAVRRRGIANVIGEMERLYFDLGVTHFRVEDSTPPPRALTKLARAITGSRLNGKIALTAFSRVDTNRAEDFRSMKQAGFLALFFGLESLHDASLRRLRKGTTYEKIRATMEQAHAAGILTVGSFIFPAPGETQESMETTLRRIRELRPVLDSALVLPAVVPPATAWGRDPEQFGVELADHYVEEGLIYPIKYEVPIRHWRPLPFTYDLMGKSAKETSFEDIVRLTETFMATIKEEYRTPRVPDYYYLLAHLAGRAPEDFARDTVKCIMDRDYAGLQALTQPVDGSPDRRNG